MPYPRFEGPAFLYPGDVFGVHGGLGNRLSAAATHPWTPRPAPSGGRRRPAPRGRRQASAGDCREDSVFKAVWAVVRAHASICAFGDAQLAACCPPMVNVGDLARREAGS